MELRNYQIDAKNNVYRAFREHRRVMLQLPTGAGKTVLFTAIAKDAIMKDRVTWVLVHRKELIDQTLHKAKAYGLDLSVIQADYLFNQFSKYHIASVQTLIRRIDKLPKRVQPGLIIVDEAHHSRAESYKTIMSKYPDALILGVTATPVRTNGEGFKDLFDTMVTGPTVKQLIHAGYLVKPRIFTAPLEFDLRNVKITAGDYNEKALYEAYEASATYGNLVSSWNKFAKDKLTIVFAINVEHSKRIVEEYKAAGINAEHVDGTTPKKERDDIMRRFREGKTRVVSNVGIITEGFDVPACECIQLVRPTKSLSLYLQMCGRGLRPAHEKESAIILDHSNSVYTHGFPEQDRNWTLGGVRNKKNRVTVYRDVRTNEYYTQGKTPEHISEIELIEMDQDEMRINMMEKLIEHSRRKNYKPGYAWHKFIERVKRPTRYEILRFQTLANYKSGWVNYQFQEFNIG